MRDPGEFEMHGLTYLDAREKGGRTGLGSPRRSGRERGIRENERKRDQTDLETGSRRHARKQRGTKAGRN